MPKLFLDMDGVLADFDSHFINTFGVKTPSKGGVSDDEMWEMVFSVNDFFLNIPPFEGAKRFFEDCTNYIDVPVFILTAASKKQFQSVARQKKAWVRKHLSNQVFVIPTYGSAHKEFYMHDAKDILIDDFEKNCNRWHEAGGISILHRNFERSIEELLIHLENRYE